MKSIDSALRPWAAIRGENWQYIEWDDIESGAITFREYYDLAANPFQLVNLLHDGDESNDLRVATLNEQPAAARSCTAGACP